MSPYFDASYFDPTYFDAGTPATPSHGGGRRHVAIVRKPPITEQPARDDGDELFVLIL